ncbi:aminopeptidase [Promethearchaeum syntrophicum]|uniref:Aminopeptidase n=1 Tax=Promethearchaeum syntrophicum TaxID=2594042 RepID=A0A5B9D6H6_9ARCH|nr:aminopeptidase [Candidatus Prometheoarchaeum syntrophicum]QEE14694.1 putative aminopeptidase 1 [Candidatus Prometheoarchaeum syntrophicum]
MNNFTTESKSEDKPKEPSLEDKLVNKFKHGWEIFTDDQKQETLKLADEYFDFLKNARTERERTTWTIKKAEENGFKRLEIGKNINKLNPGDKIYYVNREKNVAMAVIGQKSLIEKIHMIGSHIDTPRLDLKMRPLYEDGKAAVALFKTHYYGGIKKYQWATIPLHLTGLIVKKDGTKIPIDIGKNPDDPVFTIPDILPHLSKNVQNKRKSPETFKGEELNVLAGALPIDENNNKDAKKVKEKFKINILKILNEKHGITEADLQSAELNLVSGLPPRYVGLDRSMIGAAGHDDGVCSWTGIKSLIDLKGAPKNTAIMSIFDKEEIGSNGSTGAQSAWIRFVMNDIMVRTGVSETLTNLHLTLSNTLMLSADVGSAINPIFPSVHDPLNAAVLGKGIVIEKHTGGGGKYGSSDVPAEIMAYIRKIYDEKTVPYQIVELGKVDEGGGGTIAKYFAESFNCDVVDAGTPVINMHSPYEIIHIADLFSTYLAYKTFFEAD